MPLGDYNIANQTFPATRADINNQLSAILSQNSSTSAPSTTTAGMFWYDTTNGQLKQRNSADSAWVVLWSVNKQGFVPQSFSSVYGADAGSTDAYAITLDPVPAAWSDIGMIVAKVNTANTGAATLNPNSLGARTIKKNYNSDLVTGDLVANQVVALWNDGTNLQLLSPTAGGASTGPYPKRYLAGKAPYYNTAAQIVIPSGTAARDSTDAYNIDIATDRTIDLTVSGAGGLDTGSEASNTWYYVYLIDDSTGGNAGHAVFSVTNEAVTGSITLPSGYDIKRQLPLAVRNNGSSNIIPFYVGDWNPRATVFYQVTPTYYNGTAFVAGTNVVLSGGTATSYTNITLTSFVPPIAEQVYLATYNDASAGTFVIRTDGESIEGKPVGSGNSAVGFRDWYKSASQIVEYRRYFGTAGLYVDVLGYQVTEV